MNPFNWLRREAGGAWRSVRYDLDRRSGGRARGAITGEPGGGGTGTAGIGAGAADASWVRDPRRVTAAVGVAGVIVASAAGTYFAVVGGLGMLLADAAGVPVTPQAAAPFAPLAPAPHATGGRSAAKGHAHRAARPRTVEGPGPAAPAAEVIGAARPVPGGTRSAAPDSPHPESTNSVTPSASPSDAPSPSVSIAEHLARPDRRR